ncbi:Uncharacterized protein Rs2_18233 [Raphanus sativus]|nr:Uncharacterized protein Rs2_18233 [Raphanus sativus]
MLTSRVSKPYHRAPVQPLQQLDRREETHQIWNDFSSALRKACIYTAYHFITLASSHRIASIDLSRSRSHFEHNRSYYTQIHLQSVRELYQNESKSHSTTITTVSISQKTSSRLTRLLQNHTPPNAFIIKGHRCRRGRAKKASIPQETRAGVSKTEKAFTARKPKYKEENNPSLSKTNTLTQK